MADYKNIVCLANSRKPPSGRCIAGKEIIKDGYGAWVRPISNCSSEEISIEEMTFKNGAVPRIMDIIEIPIIKHLPSKIQPENYLIDYDYHWKKVGAIELLKLYENFEEQHKKGARPYCNLSWAWQRLGLEKE